MDSNADQFARMGNPWVSERDRLAMPVKGPSRRIKRHMPKLATAKPEFREEGYVRRALTAEEERRQKHLANLAVVRRLAKRSHFIERIEPASATPQVHPTAPPPLAEEVEAARAEKVKRAQFTRDLAAARTALDHRIAAARKLAAVVEGIDKFGAAMALAMGEDGE